MMIQADDPVVVYVGTLWEAGEVQGLLEDAGIQAFLQDEVMGQIDAPALRSAARGAVKIVVAREHEEQARQAIRDFGRESGKPTEPGAVAEDPAVPSPWRCRECGEEVEGQFGLCWQCGAART